ncbi:hypothetical protein E2C01_050251 [Portunus trituberculatus]|uniref:Uncharacterized protein n=1 Tax=Portunus trituberculatus TaxID=210409 RepID=A0A5B7GGT5_PORTR|nr:hypothetical protein [Portunus trituberculatus]
MDPTPTICYSHPAAPQQLPFPTHGTHLPSTASPYLRSRRPTCDTPAHADPSIDERGTSSLQPCDASPTIPGNKHRPPSPSPNSQHQGDEQASTMPITDSTSTNYQHSGHNYPEQLTGQSRDTASGSKNTKTESRYIAKGKPRSANHGHSPSRNIERRNEQHESATHGTGQPNQNNISGYGSSRTQHAYGCRRYTTTNEDSSTTYKQPYAEKRSVECDRSGHAQEGQH